MKLHEYRVSWFFYILLLLAFWWAAPDTGKLITVGLFFGAWFLISAKSQRDAEKERAIEQATEDFEKFDPELLALDGQYDALSQGYSEGANDEAQRILAARRHRIQVLLNERGLLK